MRWPSRRRPSVWRLPASVFLTVALLASLAVLTGASHGKPSPDLPPAPEKKTDGDSDKVFDDLESRLAGKPDTAKVPVIVTLDSPATEGRVRGLERAVGDFAVKYRYRVIDAFAATVTKGQVRALSRRPSVRQIEEDSEVRAVNNSAQDSFGVAKARIDDADLTGDEDASPTTYSRDDLVAAVIDTGIDPAHLDLDEGKVIAFHDVVNGRTVTYDDEGHGTHVAATVAGDGDGDPRYRGVAPDGALVGVKVLNQNGSGQMSDVTAGIDWTVQNKDAHGIEALNLSLGTSGCSDGTDATSAAVNNAHAAGLATVVAAGNSGPGTCTIGSPGAAAQALTVGAMADMEQSGFRQAHFSSRGKTADGRIKPDVSAPGVSITSAANGTTNGYATYSGTSMATPFVAGVALLMRDANPTLSSSDVKTKAGQTAVDWGRGGDNRALGSSGQDIDYGHGRLDAYAALKSAGGALSSGPTIPRHEFHEGSLPGTGAQVDYELNVTDTNSPIAATLIHPDVSGASASSPDFDLYLYDPSGAEVARAYTARRSEDLGFKPTVTGTYKLRVKSYSGSGNYFVDVSAGTAPDTTAPAITSVSPVENATGVDPAGDVSVAFSEPMDKQATEQAFSLAPTSDPAGKVSGSFSWSGNTMTFNPASDLTQGTGYTATVGTGAKDAAGNQLSAAKSWNFATKSTTAVTAFPGATSILSGSLRSGTYSRLGSDDNSYYQVNSTSSGTRTTDWYGRFYSVTNALQNLKVTYKGMNSRSCTQRVYVYRFDVPAGSSPGWVQLDSRSVSTTEVLVTNLSPSGTLADYVSGSGDGELRVKVRCTRGSPSFYASGDLLKIDYERP